MSFSAGSRSRWAWLALGCERALFALAVVCLTGVAIACTHGALFQSSEQAAFERALVASIHAEDPDTSAWSVARVAHYRAAARAEVTDSPVRALARLDIPDASVSVMLLEGTDALTLNRAVGHIEGTARPGEAGNVGIAGHRDGFFRGLQHLELGDEMSLTTLDGVSHYGVTKLEVVEPTAVEVLESTPDDSLTLVTCYPFYFVGDAPQRYIVHAKKLRAVTHASLRD